MFLQHLSYEKRQVRFLGWFKILRVGKVFISVFCLFWKSLEILLWKKAVLRRHRRAGWPAAVTLPHHHKTCNFEMSARPSSRGAGSHQPLLPWGLPLSSASQLRYSPPGFKPEVPLLSSNRVPGQSKG